MTLIPWWIRALSHSPTLFELEKAAAIAYRYAFKRLPDQDLECLGVLKDLQRPVLVDVGGNYGQSSVAMAALLPKAVVHCFEPNLALKPYLNMTRRLLGSRFHYYPVGLGVEEVSLKFFVPRLNAVLLAGEGTFRRDELGEKVTLDRIGKLPVEEFQFDVKAFDAVFVQEPLRPDFVKIDTQGFEYEVLAGMHITMRSCEPVFMLENCANASEDSRIAGLVDDWGYTKLVWDRRRKRFAEPGTVVSENYFLLPDGKRSEASRLMWMLMDPMMVGVP